jgi:hypothetical protein
MNYLKKIKSKLQTLLSSERIYPKNKQLLNAFSKYENAIIFGSSSSINKIDCTQFKDDFIITVGNFFEHPDIEIISPKVHIFAASHPPITESVLIEWWSRCNAILPKETVLLIEKRDKEIAIKIFAHRQIYFYSYGGSLPIDFTKKIFSPWSVSVVAIQLAIFCRNKNIKLIGINHDWQCLEPYAHFYDHDKPSLEYFLRKENIKISYEEQKQPFPKERLYKEYELYQQYEKLQKEARKLDLKIYNADPFSNFDVFSSNSTKTKILN